MSFIIMLESKEELSPDKRRAIACGVRIAADFCEGKSKSGDELCDELWAMARKIVSDAP